MKIIYFIFILTCFVNCSNQEDLTFMLPGQNDHLELFFKNKKIFLPNIERNDLIDAINLATDIAENQMQIIEPNILNNGIVQTPDSPGWYLAAFSRTKVIAKNYSFTAIILENASKILAQKYNLNKEEINFGLNTLNTQITPLSCPMPSISFPCHPGKYRSHNGNCNNVQNPQWGSSSMPYNRYLFPEYSDGVSLPKGSIFNRMNHDLKRKKRYVSDEFEFKRLINLNNQTKITFESFANQNMNFNKKFERNLIKLSLENKDIEYFNKNFKNTPTYFCNEFINEFVSKSSFPSKKKMINDFKFRIKRFANNITYEKIKGSYGLPNVRTVALALHNANHNSLIEDNGHLTTLMVFFAQFVLHDFAHTAQCVGHKGHRIKCCNIGEHEHRHPECWPIHISKKDPIYNELGQKCMEYVRSIPTIRVGCTLGPREQINQVTSFLDGSVIYGSSEEEAKGLRLFENGFLKGQYYLNHSTKNKKKNEYLYQLLPPIDTSQDCRSKNRTHCFKSGDIRVNENIGLTIMHTLWARRHNRIASKLKKINSNWTDEQLYQESRKILGAQLQHITYNELLPVILGNEIMNEFKLNSLKTGYYYGYNIDLNPSVSNALATSVMPFFYTMLPEHLEKYTETLKKSGFKRMSDTYFNPSELYDAEIFDEYIFGLMNQNAKNPNLFYNNEMTNSLSKQMNEALDLISVILQQGRDHGLPGYTKWLNSCNKRFIVNDFNDLQNIMSSSVILKFSSIYNSVHDIDLFTGGLAEHPLRGAIVGPTFACLLGRQFYYLKRGDRYWYENDLPPNRFTKEQLHEIRKSTLSSIICENGNKIPFVQPQTVFVSDPYLNAFQYCNNIDYMDLNKWKSTENNMNFNDVLNKENIDQAIRNAFAEFSNKKNSINNHVIGIHSIKSPQGDLLGFLRPKRQALEINQDSVMLEFISNNLVTTLMDIFKKDHENNLQVKSKLNQMIKSFPQIDLVDYIERNSINTKSELIVSNQCNDHILPCDYTNSFRTASGWCNNIDNPEFGSSYHVFLRFLPPDYNDGITEPRKYSITGNELPSGRLISTTIHSDKSNLHNRYSLITMQWGQFLDHDITFTPQSMGPNNSLLNCNKCDSQTTVHSECWPIKIPENDYYFSKNYKRPKCLHFVRSLNGQKKLGHRDQINQVTSFLDGSQIYGSDICDANKLRSFKQGQLNITKHLVNGYKPLLPVTTSNVECRAPSGVCFEAGDLRSSEQPALACMHTIWIREHNRIVKELNILNPQWNDEILYQNGRKIIGAQLQFITYNEFLPRILGIDYMKRFKLVLLEDGYFDSYDKNCDATIYNEISSAVLRFGHSLLRPSFLRLNKKFQTAEEPLKLRHNFFNSDMLFKANAIDNILRGIISASIETLDSSITEEVTNHLFEDKNVPFSGMDLISLNIQRARDHGLPGYNFYREKCNLTRANNFNDLAEEISPNNLERLKQIYEDVDDIDLFSGGISEIPLHGGSVGPTFGCILTKQFIKLKKCDRFWFETSNAFTRFSEKQLAEIRKTSLAKVVCENSDSITMIQKNVMDLSNSFTNPRIPCKSLPSIDLIHWKERSSFCTINKKIIDIGKSEYVSPCVMCICTKEGMICNSIKIKNCFLPFNKFKIEDILNDSVCKVQCSFVYRLQSSITKIGKRKKISVLDFYQKMHFIIKNR